MQRSQILGIMLIAVVMAVGILVKFIGVSSNDKVFNAISSYTKDGLWELPKKSKYFTYNYPEGSGLKQYAALSGWPGDLEKGFGKEYLESALKEANQIANNKFSEIRINKKWKSSAINIYFFNSSKQNPFGLYKDNCAYLGFKNIIICDTNIIKRIGTIDYLEKELDSTLQGKHFSTVLNNNRNFRKLALLRHLGPAHTILLWMIGHEIGHIAKGHKVGHFVEPDKYSEIIQSQELENLLEVEADQFALKSFRNSEVTAAMFWAIHQMIAYEINKQLIKQGKNLTVHLKDFYEPLSLRLTSKTHPPLLKRLLTFGVIINQMIPFKAEYLERINNNTRLTR